MDSHGRGSFFRSKKGGKHASKPPPPLSKVTAPGPGAQPSGGHIIPATDITILDKELGRGEFGKVMQGMWRNGEGGPIPVAVKCLSPDKLAMDKCQQDFLKEAAIMHSLNHDHLVKLYGVVLDVNSSLMLVTEFAPLRSLAENIRQEALKASFPITLLLDFSVQMADAMRYLHITNIIHRDLAARNILLFVDDTGNKKVKISDFGLSRRLILGENYRSEMRPNLKLPLAWMPVESLTKLTFTKASDVWSFGVTMWEMFSYGRQPFSTLSGEEILNTIDKPKLERLQRPEACPPNVYEIMQRCWAHEPESRASFSDLCEELPKVRPMQVKAIGTCTAMHPEELTYRADDIISVVEINEDTGVWKGVNPMGRIGYFQRADTVALGNGHSGKLKRWRSGRSSKTENRRSKLTLEDISKPKDYKHIFHVGVDGKVEGDPTFGGDYRNIPKTEEESSPSKTSSEWSDSKESTPSKSPAKPKKKNNNNKKNISAPVIELSKETILPPPNGFDSGSTISVPDVVPIATTTQLESAPPPQKAPIASLAEPEITYTNGSTTFSSLNSKDDYVTKNDAAPATTDDLSLSPTFEMGSLLDDMMSVWDTAKQNLDIAETLQSTPEEAEGEIMAEEEDSQSLLEGEEYELCNGDDASLSRSTNRVLEDSSETSEPAARVNGSGEPAGGVLHGGLSGSDEVEEQGAVGGASAVGSFGKGAERGLLTGNIIIKDTMTKPTKSYRKVPRQTPSSEDEGNGTVSKPEPQTQEQAPAPRSRPGREVNASRQMSREKRWDSEFKRLSSCPKDRTADNDYVDTSAMQKKGAPGSEEYEELALASSPQPYTLRDNVLDSANVMRGPRLSDASRSISMRTTRPSPEGFEARNDVELSRSHSLREPPISPLGQQAYNSLIGGEISSSNMRRTRPEGQDRRVPAVPPKPPPKPPSRIKASERMMSDGRARNGDARMRGSSSRSTSGNSSDDSISHDIPYSRNQPEDIQGNLGAVASLRKRFNTSQMEDAPPRPPRESPETLSQRQMEQTKVSTYGGVRLRRRDQTTDGMNGSYYASEHENNNSSTEESRLSPTTLQNLEQHMPRRMRRSVGEDRIKRRNSSDVSDSETDSNKSRTERGWSVSSRTSEGDSSSEETLSSNRLSSSSNERGSFSESRASGYKSPPRPLYDLPEDQTNSIRSAAHQPPPPLPPQEQVPHLHSSDGSHMDEKPPPLPPRVAPCRELPNGGARDILETRPPDGGGIIDHLKTSENVLPPPRPERRGSCDRVQRSRTFDGSPAERMMDSRNGVDQSNYDILPVHRPVRAPFKSHSIDVVDLNDDYMVGSAASIRQLLKAQSVGSSEKIALGTDQVDCDIDDADNLDDMPETSPPPVPTNRKSFVDNTYGEIPFMQKAHGMELNSSADYVMMRPQTHDDVKREYIYSDESDYAVPRNIPYRSEVSSTSQMPVVDIPSSRSPVLARDKANYQLMHPASQRRSRTRSDLPSRPVHVSTAKPLDQRRGTVSASSLRMGSGDCDRTSSLRLRDHSKQLDGSLSNGRVHRMRRSRSSDDILKDDDWTAPQEAESLQDLLARAYISPNDRQSQQDPRSKYLVPPSARHRHPPPPPSPESHNFTGTSPYLHPTQYSQGPPAPVPGPPSSTISSSTPPLKPNLSTPPPKPKLHSHTFLPTPPSAITSSREAEYLDMSQASLERKKQQWQKHQKSGANWPDPVSQGHDTTDHTSPSMSSPSSSSSSSVAITRPLSSSSTDHSPTSVRMRPDPLAESLFVPRYIFDPNDEEVDL